MHDLWYHQCLPSVCCIDERSLCKSVRINIICYLLVFARPSASPSPPLPTQPGYSFKRQEIEPTSLEHEGDAGVIRRRSVRACAGKWRCLPAEVASVFINHRKSFIMAQTLSRITVERYSSQPAFLTSRISN